MRKTMRGVCREKGWRKELQRTVEEMEEKTYMRLVDRLTCFMDILNFKPLKFSGRPPR